MRKIVSVELYKNLVLILYVFSTTILLIFLAKTIFHWAFRSAAGKSIIDAGTLGSSICIRYIEYKSPKQNNQSQASPGPGLTLPSRFHFTEI